ncbi:hypothetical protein ACFQX7_03055 [Luedemannella flava]
MLEQLRRVDDLLSEVIEEAWPAFRAGCREEFVRAVESEPGSDDRRLFEWELLNEFACVLNAEKIKPGINADREYLDLPRSPWMMSLDSDREKRFVLHLYARYIQGLERDGLISNDQIMSDFFLAVDTWRWNYERKTQGYDRIFVDELHLFNGQERLVLQYFYRHVDQYPIMYVALDPRQSPQMTYVGVPANGLVRGDTNGDAKSLGTSQLVSLTRVHRFSPDVLALLRHINHSYPAVSLDEDWELDLDAVDSSRPSRAVPTVYRHSTRYDEALAVLRRCRQAAENKGGKSRRVAVVLVDPDALTVYEEIVFDHADSVRPQILRARDDVVGLRYAQKTIVLSPVEYVAGLQFDVVIVAGLRPVRRGPWSTNRLRQMLSMLYLAISRATDEVEIHVNLASGGIPDILASAIEANKLVLDA